MNSPKVQAAIEATFKEMMSWPPWYFRFRLWWHWHFGKRHWITGVLQETGYFERFAAENRAKSGESQQGEE